MSVVISLLNMKAPPSPPGRRSGTVQPPLGDLEVSFRPDSPADFTLSGDSHGPTLVHGSATSNDLSNGHYESEEAIVENKIPAGSGLERALNGTTQFNNGPNGIPNMVNRGNNSPTQVNGGSNNIPNVVNGDNNSPTMMNGGHTSIPNQVNGGNNGPAQVNSVSHYNGAQPVNGNETRTAPLARNYVKEQNLVNGFGKGTFPFSDIPAPRRKLSADTPFFFPEPRHIQFSSSSVGRDSPVLSSPISTPSHSNHSSPRVSRKPRHIQFSSSSVGRDSPVLSSPISAPSHSNHSSPRVSRTRLERHYSVVAEGEEGEEDEEKDGGGGGGGGEGGRPNPHHDTEDEMEKISRALGDMSPFVRQHLHHVENRFFEMFGDKEKQTININKFLTGVTATGMRHSDPRLKETFINLKMLREKSGSLDLQVVEVDYDTFMTIISDNLEVLVKAFSSSFIIPDFHGFCHHLDQIYNSCLSNTSGNVASYIPQLARSKADHWAMSVCTVDGQRYSIGDVNTPFTLQSCSKPLTYAMALGLNGTDSMHSFIGMEPSGRYFNELCLDYSNKPHNPMINAGAIMTAALVKPELSAADRFDFVFNMYKRLAADEFLGFNNAVFLSEKECADRNFALAYFMRENKCFPAGTRLHETLDFYFQLCSLEITAESGAVMAATLANGGLNPLTGDPVLTGDAVRNTLTLMHSCGMYNYSGQFAFKVGLPSKSGVSGCVLLVVPNTMGICLWSPRLDSNGNSCRAVQFCMELVSRFNFHNFDNLRGHFTTKIDPRTVKAESTAQILFDLLFSAAAGDLSALRRHSLSGTDMEAQDYDGRTALHVATSEGHVEIVEYLIQNCQVCPLPKDRWGRTPLDDAISFCQPICAALIKDSCKRKGIELPSGSTATTPTTATSTPLPNTN